MSSTKVIKLESKANECQEGGYLLATGSQHIMSFYDAYNILFPYNNLLNKFMPLLLKCKHT